MRRKIWSFSWIILPMAWMGLIYYFSDQSVLPGPEAFWLDVVIKKVAHVLVYAGLFWCWFRFGQATGWIKKHGSWAIILALCLAYAIFDEWHQGQVPGRIMSERDILLDFYASSLAALWSARLL